MTPDSSSLLSLAQKTIQCTNGNNIIAVASGKGGVGKTWLSIAMAGLLAGQNQKVLLFDGDFGLANIDVQLGITPNQDIGGVLSGKIPMNKAITHFDAGGFDLIAGRSGCGSLGTLTDASLQLLKDDLMLLATHYDKVIVDLGSGIGSATRLFAKAAGTVLILCADEPSALTDAYTLIKILTQEKRTDTLRIIINSATTQKEGDRTYDLLVKACDSFLKVTPPLAGIIRRDSHVIDAIRRQVSVINAYPDCVATKDVLSLLKNLK